MAVCGAGCMGFVNNALGVRALGYLEPDPLPAGGVSLVTHSGSAFSTLLRARRGFGFRLAVSSGQELVTDTADYVDYALDDPETRIIGLLLETPRAVPRLRQALLRAAEQDVPVVILTVGGSPRGRVMVAAHSGALAGEHAAWQAFCAATGAVHVTRSGRVQRHPRAVLRRAAGQAAAALRRCMIRAPNARCSPTSPTSWASSSPISLPSTLATIGGMLDDGLAPPTRWTCGVPAPTPATCSAPACARWSTTLPSRSPRWPSTWSPSSTATPPTPMRSPTSPSTPMRRWRCWRRWRRRSTRRPRNGCETAGFRCSRVPAAGWRRWATWPAGRCPSTAPSIAVQSRQARRAGVTGIPAAVAPFELLADYGVPVVASVPPTPSARRCQAADALGYPVALKTVGALHKSDVGGVVLEPDRRDRAARGVRGDGRLAGPAVTVEPMVEAGVEVSVGFVRDDGFGPLLIVAAGGTLVELLADRVVACPPVSHAGALQPARRPAHRAAAGRVARRTGGRHRRAGGGDRGVLAVGDRTRRCAGRGRGQSGDRVTRTASSRSTHWLQASGAES